MIIVLFLLPMAVLIPDMVINHTKRIFFPSPTDKVIYKEMNSLVKIKKGTKSPVMPYDYQINHVDGPSIS